MIKQIVTGLALMAVVAGFAAFSQNPTKAVHAQTTTMTPTPTTSTNSTSTTTPKAPATGAALQ